CESPGADRARTASAARDDRARAGARRPHGLAGRQGGCPAIPIYAATKFGLRGFGHALRAELRGTGVGVSLISPTYVSEAGMWAETGQRAPIGEVTPAEVADAIVIAILKDRAEVTVTSLPLRLATRIPMACPELIHTPVARGAGGHPDAAVESQKAKR